jgi:major type 1 subunit fimbrin (pilin)
MSSRKALAGLALVLTGFGCSAMAATDGNVKFTGEIVDTPCIVATGDSGDNQTVALGKVKSSIFTAAKVTSADQGFSITLEDCDTSTKKSASVMFDGTHNTADNDLLAIDNVAGAATGVGIELMDNAGKAIPMNTAGADNTLQNGENKLSFKAHYKSTAAVVTPGAANAQATFAVSYK